MKDGTTEDAQHDETIEEFLDRAGTEEEVATDADTVATEETEGNSEEDAKPDGETEEPAAETDKEAEKEPDPAEEAARLVELAKTNPRKFLKEHGVDQFGPQFAALVKEKRSLRQEREELKGAQSELKGALEFKKAFEANPTAFMRDNMDADTFHEIANGFIDPAKAATSALERRLAQMEELVKGRDAADEKQQQETTSAAEQERDIRKYVDTSLAHAAEKHDFLLTMYDRGELQERLGEIVSEHKEGYDEYLTADSATDILAERSIAWAKKSGFTRADEGHKGPVKEPAPGKADTSPPSLTNKRASAVARAEKDELYDLPEDDQMAALLAQNR